MKYLKFLTGMFYAKRSLNILYTKSEVNFAFALKNCLEEEFDMKIVLTEYTLPSSAYYAPRNRYRGEKLLEVLKDEHPLKKNHYTLLLTEQDLSTTRYELYDWGIYSLSDVPNNNTVISTYRLSKQRNHRTLLYNLILEELSSLFKVNCNEPTCYTTKTEGLKGITQKTGYCPKCKYKLKTILR